MQIINQISNIFKLSKLIKYSLFFIVISFLYNSWPYNVEVCKIVYYSTFYIFTIILSGYLFRYTFIFSVFIIVPLMYGLEYLNESWQPWIPLQNHPYIFVFLSIFPLMIISYSLAKFLIVTKDYRKKPSKIPLYIQENKNIVAIPTALTIMSIFFMDTESSATLAAWLSLIPLCVIIIPAVAEITKGTERVKVYNKEKETYEEKIYVEKSSNTNFYMMFFYAFVIYIIFVLIPYVIEHGDHLGKMLIDMYELKRIN